MITLEKVQRRATKLLVELKDLSYRDRLKRLHLPSIKYRQLRSDLIQTYKIINHIDNINCDEFFKFSSYDKTRNPHLKLYKTFAKTKTRCNFLTNRVNDLWNSLSVDTRSAKDITAFKIGIDNELKHLMHSYEE